MIEHREEVSPFEVGRDLSLDDVIAVARRKRPVVIPKDVEAKLITIRENFDAYITEIVEWQKENKKNRPKDKNTPEYRESELKRKQKMMYGVTTGFGEHKTRGIEGEDNLEKLQLNLVRSHTCGVGNDFDPETTRAIMTLRINTLASGYCGISFKIVEQLRDFLNSDIRPCIPEQGSVGASGDLAPLAHLALALIGEGPVKYRKAAGLIDDLEKLKEKHPELETDPDSRFDTLRDLRKKHPELKIDPDLKLAAKDGLALINGLAVTTAIGVLAHADARNLLEWADVIGAMTLESLLGSSRAFDEIALSKLVYRHEGARESAERIQAMITGSELINRSSDVHDAYSLRCIPQVHGAVRDALRYVGTTLENQINSVDDDPIIFHKDEIDANKPFDFFEPPEGTDPEEWKKRRHFEQGNFHGEPVAFAMDLLAIVVSELGSISERRIQMLLDKHHNRELPSCLIRNPTGVNSGYMIAQYTAAALASENKTLSHPASVDSIPTSANTEDHVSMGTIAARKARRIIENVKHILAIELMCAAEALSYRVEKNKCWQDPEELHPKELHPEEQVQNNQPIDRPQVKGACGNGTAKLYEAVKSSKDRILFLDDSVDEIVYTRIQAAKDQFTGKSPSEFNLPNKRPGRDEGSVEQK